MARIGICICRIYYFRKCRCMELVVSEHSMSYMLLSEVPMLRNQFRKLYGVYGTSKSYMSYIQISEVPMLRNQFRNLYGMYRKL